MITGHWTLKTEYRVPLVADRYVDEFGVIFEADASTTRRVDVVVGLTLNDYEGSL